MTDLTEVTEKKKPGPKAKPKVDVEALQKRVDALEGFVAKMAHWQGGNIPKIAREFGIEPYDPQKKDMARFG